MRHSYYGDLQGSFDGTRLGVLQARLVDVAVAVVTLLVLVLVVPLAKWYPALMPMAKVMAFVAGWSS